MKFKNIGDLLEFYENKGYETQFREGNLIDEYCIYKPGIDYIVILEGVFKDFLGCSYTDYDIKRYKVLPDQYENYFFGDAYYDYLERMDP